MEAVAQRFHSVCEALGYPAERTEQVKAELFPHLKKPTTITPFDFGESIAAVIDHTLLKPEATSKDIAKLCEEAVTHHFACVCVNACRVQEAVSLLEAADSAKISKVGVAAVVGFPLGATTTATKAAETHEVVSLGASEVDMVLNIGKLKDSQYAFVLDDITAVVKAAAETAKGATVKVILECGLLSKEQMIDACVLSVMAGAAFVKTSTGFIAAAGGAKLEDVSLMKSVVGERALVKASGGVRSYREAVAMVKAGAARIGASAGVAIVAEEKKENEELSTSSSSCSSCSCSCSSSSSSSSIGDY
ncbi:Deoxyribose-phosphate aldolase [Balamuthia mandrillaris]